MGVQSGSAAMRREVFDVLRVCGTCRVWWDVLCVCVCVGRVVCVWDVLCVLGTVAKMVIFTPGVDLVLSAL